MARKVTRNSKRGQLAGNGTGKKTKVDGSAGRNCYVMRLSVSAAKEFLSALQKPAAPNNQLRAAAQKYRVFVERE